MEIKIHRAALMKLFNLYGLKIEHFASSICIEPLIYPFSVVTQMSSNVETILFFLIFSLAVLNTILVHMVKSDWREQVLREQEDYRGVLTVI